MSRAQKEVRSAGSRPKHMAMGGIMPPTPSAMAPSPTPSPMIPSPAMTPQSGAPGGIDPGVLAMAQRAASSMGNQQPGPQMPPQQPPPQPQPMGMKDGGHWIAGATKNKGALHRKLGVPEGEKIPASKLAKAANSSNPTERKEASLAKTLKGFHKG